MVAVRGHGVIAPDTLREGERVREPLGEAPPLREAEVEARGGEAEARGEEEGGAVDSAVGEPRGAPVAVFEFELEGEAPLEGEGVAVADATVATLRTPWFA